MTTAAEAVRFAAELLQRQTRDINRTAAALVDELELLPVFARPFPNELRVKLEQLFVEGISQPRIDRAIEMIAEAYPDL